jgi:peptidoglycan/LPS O-acetylase OafA/YrhL
MKALTDTLPERKSDYIMTLDGWRALAVIAVLVSHANPVDAVAAPSAGELGRLTMAVIERIGSAGVMVFFAISGFLICSRLLTDEEKTGAISLRVFYIRRVFRILPPALGYLLILLALHLTGLLEQISREPFRWGSWFGTIFFVTNYLHIRMLSLNHYWSLAVEEQFYFFWPGILAFGGRRRAALFAAAVVIIIPIVRVMTLTTASLPEYSRILERTEMRVDSFMGPCLIAILLTVPGWRKIFLSLSSSKWQVTWIAVIALCSILPLLSPSLQPWQRGVTPSLITILVVSTTLNPSNWLGHFLELAPMRTIGRLSYSIYLWQQLVLCCRVNASASLGTFYGLHRWDVIATGLLALALLCWFSYKWIEVPLIRVGRRLATGHRLATPTR